MIRKNYIILPILIAISGCSLIPERSIQIESKPIQIDIMQPDLPRPVNLTAPKWVCSIRSEDSKSMSCNYPIRT